MAAPKKRSHEGIRVRHSRACASTSGSRCNCKPTYEAWVYLKREEKKVRKSFSNYDEAKIWRADALGAASRGKLRAPEPTTVGEAWADFLDGARAGTIPNRNRARYKPSVLRGYERSMRLRVLPAVGGARLTELRRADVQALADELIASGLAASTVQNTLDPLRALYRRAMRRDLVAIDPTDGLDLHGKSGRRERIASPEEAADLLALVPEDDRALWATAMYAGLRRGELRALRWADVDLASRKIHVKRGWDDEEGEIEGKSKAARRTVSIPAPLIAELADHKLRTGRDGDDLVFGMTESRPFVPSSVRHRALEAWEAAGKARGKGEPEVVPITLHECRHTFASLAIAAGVNAKALQAMMGHTSIQMTFDHYGHLMPGGLDEARQRIDAYLAGDPDRPVLAVVG